MDKTRASEVLRELAPGVTRVFYNCADGVKVTALRREEQHKRLKNPTGKYDFAIGLEIPGKPEFKPNHLRLLIDLHLKMKSNPKAAPQIFESMEKIFSGEDPEVLLRKFEGVNFPMKLDNIDVNLYCAQLFMIEQEFNWGKDGPKKSKFDPPSLFLMGYIRMVAADEKELDKILWSVVKGHPPMVKFTGENYFVEVK